MIESFHIVAQDIVSGKSTTSQTYSFSAMGRHLAVTPIVRIPMPMRRTGDVLIANVIGIGNATYVLDGKRYYTPRNDGNGTMHSGPNGWSWRVWNVAEVCDDSITFTLRDEPFSSKGFPGLVLAQVTYKMSPNTWSIKIEAKSQTHRTPLMATNHAYWNLDAFANPINNTVFNQTLSMPYSKRLIDYDATAFPNGSISAIPEYAINDFWSSPKHIGANSTAPGWVGLCGPGFGGYDCAYIMDRPNDAAQQWQHSSVASLYSDWSGIGWSMYSNQEGFAMTSCGFFPLDTLPIKKTQGGPGSSTNGFVPPNGCIAIEAQDWTSGIQFPGWGRLPYQVYGPDDGTYVNEIVYKFSVY